MNSCVNGFYIIRETIKPRSIPKFATGFCGGCQSICGSLQFLAEVSTLFGEVSGFYLEVDSFNKKEAIFRGKSHFHKKWH